MMGIDMCKSSYLLPSFWNFLGFGFFTESTWVVNLVLSEVVVKASDNVTLVTVG